MVMKLDINTLFMVTIYVEAILGLLLLFAWIQNSSIYGVAWWGFSDLTRALSIVLFGLHGSIPNVFSIDLANALLFTSFAMTWTGARLFDGRKPLPLGLIAGAATWLIFCRIPGTAEMNDLRVLLSSSIVAVYTWLTAYEFWRGRGEPLVSRWPAIFILFAHGALFLLRTPMARMLPWSPTNEVFGSVWLTAMSFEAVLFTIAIAFILLAMAKERTEFRHKTAAMVDPLTGIANRRAFLHEGAQAMKRQNVNARPGAVLLVDLDHFKSINDRFGHAIGDRVLQVFAECAKANIKNRDLIGRLGGEEFAALIHDTDRERALIMAERIRSAFAAAAAEVDGRPVMATVSIGMVCNDDSTFDVPALLAQADQALYHAKERGRNRVEIASLELVRLRKQEADAREAPSVAAMSAA
jgi:diguanylate cyclase (GGDEF)-like protein